MEPCNLEASGLDLISPPPDPKEKEKGRAKEQSSSERKKTPHKKCNMCFEKLPSAYKKPVCKKCLDNLIREEKTSFMDEMRSFIQEEVRSSVSSSLAAFAPQEPPQKRQKIVDSSSDPASDSDGATVRDSLEPDTFPSTSANRMESRYLLASEDLEPLLKAVRDTLKIEEVEETQSIQDELFGLLKAKKRRVFPVNNTLRDLILEEWRDPENKISLSKEFRNSLSFDEEEAKLWNSAPKMDIQVTKMTKKTDLPFEDATQLKDPLDRKADSLLKKSWECSMLNLKSNIATTSVARTLFHWVMELEKHVRDGTPRELLLNTFPTLKAATAFIADASAEGVRISAKEGALSNSVRRSLWLRQWSGDFRSKSKLCGIPFKGEYVFGPELDTILERAADKKKGFPESRTSLKKPSFRDPKERRPSFRGKGKQGRWSYPKGGRGRGFLLNPSNSATSFRKQ
ncbi:uncharacterized protein [Engystomops pustulosus]|uniref:uncharacterized protein n=1 Tax=Engystomops pustulosus TaxID=76066 RepID=UPI003AFB546A